MHGYTDEAIGHFSADVDDVSEACGEVIRRWWSEMYSQAMQQPWEYYDIWNAGPVDEETAKEWAWQVSGEHDVEYSPPWFEKMLADRRPNSDEEYDYEEIGPGSAERPSFSVIN